jgi:hypothetical protein
MRGSEIISNQQSAISNQQSAVSSQQSAVSMGAFGIQDHPLDYIMKSKELASGR